MRTEQLQWFLKMIVLIKYFSCKQIIQDVQYYKDVFGGNIYFDSAQNGCYQWSIQSREDVLNMLEYFKKHTSRSYKSQRLFLIPDYFAL